MWHSIEPMGFFSYLIISRGTIIERTDLNPDSSYKKETTNFQERVEKRRNEN
jgi:hypothetical protein